MGQRGSRFGAGSFSADSHEARASALIERQCLQKECTNSIDQKHKRTLKQDKFAVLRGAAVSAKRNGKWICVFDLNISNMQNHEIPYTTAT